MQPLILVKRGEQETEVILEIVEVRHLAVGEVGRFKDKPLRDEATAPELIEDNQIADIVYKGFGLWFGERESVAEAEREGWNGAATERPSRNRRRKARR